MPFNDLSEVERYITNLNEETKQRLISTISFMLINHVNQQNNLDSFSLIQKLAVLLPPDSQRQLLSEMNSTIIKSMLKNNIEIFPIIQKLESTLNDDNKRKVLSDINFIVESTTAKQNNVSITATQPGNIGKQTNLNMDKPGLQPMSNQDSYTPHYGTNSVLRQTMNGQLRMTNPPPPPPTENQTQTPSPGLGGIPGNSLLRQTVNSSLRMTNPPPESNTSVPNPGLGGIPGNSLLRQTVNGTQNLSGNGGNKAMTSTGIFNIKPKGEIITTQPAKETIKYITPMHTDVGKRAIGDFSTPTEIYQLLKQINGINTLDKIYNDLYSKLDIAGFIGKIYTVFNARQIILKKSKDMPNKDPRVKVGEWLVALGYIDNEKLDKIIQLHSVAVKNYDANNRRFAAKTMINSQPVDSKSGPLFGAFLLESDVITREQLEYALNVQSQFNEMLSALV